MKLSILTLIAVLASGFAIAFAPTTQAAPPGDTIAAIVIANPDVTGDGEGDFDTLLAAVLAADPAVLATLDGNGQHTVFAPTDDAFAAVDPDTLADLLDDQDALTKVLLYHVAPGRRYAADVLDSDRINTLVRGKDGFLEQEGGVLTDNQGGQATIILTDVEAANGVIHVIDAVVLP